MTAGVEVVSVSNGDCRFAYQRVSMTARPSGLPVKENHPRSRAIRQVQPDEVICMSSAGSSRMHNSNATRPISSSPFLFRFSQLALGATIQVPLLDPEEVSPDIEVPAGTQHGALFRLNGRGLPGLRSPKRGDLVAILQVVVPRQLDESQRELLARFAETEDIEVNASNPSFWNRVKDAVTGR